MPPLSANVVKFLVQRRIAFTPPLYDLMGWKIIMMKSQLAQPSRVTEPRSCPPAPPTTFVDVPKGLLADRTTSTLTQLLATHVKLLLVGRSKGATKLWRFQRRCYAATMEIAEVT